MRIPSLLLGALLHHPSPRQESVMAASEADSMLVKIALERGGDISASQEGILVTSSFLGLPDSDEDEEEEEEVFATPPDAMCTLPFTPTPAKSPAPHSTDVAQTITMRTLPFTPTPTKSPAPPSTDDDDAPRRKPRVCTRKVKAARISTPSPSPSRSPEQQQEPEEQQPQPPHDDPLVRAVLMMPTRTSTAAATTSSSSSTQDAVRDFLALARQKGIF